MLKRVLWLCNKPFTNNPAFASGTWLETMGLSLVSSGKITLGNISFGYVKEPTRQDCGAIAQWIMPNEKLSKDGLPSDRTVKAIKEIVDEFKPDLIHVWGMEYYWGLLTARKIIKGKVILDIQGIKHICAKVFYGGLNFKELVQCIGILELRHPSCSLFAVKRHFGKWGKYEIEMMKNHHYISVPSDWVRAHITAVNPSCTLFSTNYILRPEFEKALPWGYNELSGAKGPVIFTSNSGSVSHKGLHVAFRALALLKQRYPNISLNIAGTVANMGIRQPGYFKWLMLEAKKLGIGDSIKWLGPLNALELVEQFHHSSVVVVPSFVETYCLALSESMMVGVPNVVSYAGAMPEMAQNEKSALFFPSGDEVMCAWQIDRILQDKNLAKSLSQNARMQSLERNNSIKVLNQQLEIYNQVLA